MMNLASHVGLAVLMTAVVNLGLAAAPTSDDESPISLVSVAGTYYAEGPTGGICRLELRAEGLYSEVCSHGDTMILHHGRIQLGRTKLALWRGGTQAVSETPQLWMAPCLASTGMRFLPQSGDLCFGENDTIYLVGLSSCTSA